MPFSCVAELRTFSMNSLFDKALEPVQTQSSEKNFSRAGLFCCSSLAVSASILRRACSSGDVVTTWLWIAVAASKSPETNKAAERRMIHLQGQKGRRRTIYRRDAEYTEKKRT